MTGYQLWADTWMVFSMYYWRHNHPVFMYTGLCKCWTLFFLRALTLLNKSAYFFLKWDFYFCITFICENLKLKFKIWREKYLLQLSPVEPSLLMWRAQNLDLRVFGSTEEQNGWSANVHTLQYFVSHIANQGSEYSFCATNIKKVFEVT